MRKKIVAGMATLAVLAVPATAAGHHYAWPKTSGVVLPASTNSTAASCSRADAVLDSWLRSIPTSARPVGYNSATLCGRQLSPSAMDVDMRLMCSNHDYYCQAGGYWDGYVDWDRVNSSSVRVRIIVTRR